MSFTAKIASFLNRRVMPPVTLLVVVKMTNGQLRIPARMLSLSASVE